MAAFLIAERYGKRSEENKVEVQTAGARAARRAFGGCKKKISSNAAKFCAKWRSVISLASVVLAALIVVLPVFFLEWRQYILSTPLTGTVFIGFSTSKLWGLASILPGTPDLYAHSKIKSISNSDYGYPYDISGVGMDDVFKASLYPRTLIEERLFWVDIYYDLYMATVWWFLVFGGFAYFLE